MKCLGMLLIALISSSALAAGVNTRFDYSAKCKSTAAYTASYRHVASTAAVNLPVDLEELDNVIRIITDKNEDADFRFQVLGTAETMRQILVYGLNRLKDADAQLASELIQVCKLQGMDIPIADQLAAEFAEIVSQLDGVDPQNP